MDDIKAAQRLRLQKIQNTLKINQLQFAKQLKTNPSFISQMLNGGRNITIAFAYKISERYPWVNPEWLIYGTGSMYKGEAADSELDEVHEPRAEYNKGDPVGDFAESIRTLERRVDTLERKVDSLIRQSDKT
jgi:transcriptional regulator with XRE-family HTH domain